MQLEVPSYIDSRFREKMKSLMPVISENLPSGEALVDVFVSNPRGGDPQIRFSAWLFTENLVVEVRNPHFDDRIQHDLAPIRECVDWIRFDARNYDFSEYTPESELSLEFSTKDGLTGELFASGEGCKRLMEIYRSRFLPNFIWTLSRHNANGVTHSPGSA